MTRFLTRYVDDRRGVAAVEFALLVPVLAGILVLSFAAWESGVRKQNMRSALKTAAEYYMNGGVADADAREVALLSWDKRPPDARVSTSRRCRCGSLTVECSSVCNAGPPAVYVTVYARAEVPDAMFGSVELAERTIRVR